MATPNTLFLHSVKIVFCKYTKIMLFEHIAAHIYRQKLWKVWAKRSLEQPLQEERSLTHTAKSIGAWKWTRIKRKTAFGSPITSFRENLIPRECFPTSYDKEP